ncbi:tyrosine-type recombinase/integrase [Curtobacterium oceanosedimentum]|uniref:tyrosine-type recombinase/integrase n=1 Tax=Curtobacterium oceanosedimentum TaxID=465820 RepID=UPI00339584B7
MTATPWVVALQAYASHQRAQNLAPRTISTRHQMLSALARDTRKTPKQITTTDLLARMGRGIAASSMQRERSDLRAFFAWAKQQGIVRRDPAKHLPKVVVPRSRPRPFTMQQVARILEGGAYRRTRVMIFLALYQGLRAHEIAKFAGTDVDLFSHTLTVTGKGGKTAALPLHPSVAAIARTMPSGYWFPARGGNGAGHIHYRSVSDLMTKAIRRVGIIDPHLTGHSFRHTYGTELVASGVDIRVVQELMRHESLQSTQIYTLVSDQLKRDGLAAMPVVALPVHSGRSRPAA